MILNNGENMGEACDDEGWLRVCLNDDDDDEAKRKGSLQDHVEHDFFFFLYSLLHLSA